MSAEALAADLAARFSLRKRARSWGGDCPSCSYHGAFSIKLGKGRQPILYCANGCTRDQLNDTAQNALGSVWTPPPPPNEQDVAQKRAAKQAAALRLWSGSTPCAATPAATYLASRGLVHLVASPALRFRGDCYHGGERSRHPALIANVQDATGATVGVHRTYLERDGRKASLDPPKASLGPIWTAAIRLDDAGPELVVGEGIETAASAGLLLGLPAWAALSAGNMAAALILPPEVRRVVIAADHDHASRNGSRPGQDAARDAAARWRGEGRTVRIATPDRAGQDFNDLLQERGNA